MGETLRMRQSRAQQTAGPGGRSAWLIRRRLLYVAVAAPGLVLGHASAFAQSADRSPELCLQQVHESTLRDFQPIGLSTFDGPDVNAAITMWSRVSLRVLGLSPAEPTVAAMFRAVLPEAAPLAAALTDWNADTAVVELFDAARESVWTMRLPASVTARLPTGVIAKTPVPAGASRTSGALSTKAGWFRAHRATVARADTSVIVLAGSGRPDPPGGFAGLRAAAPGTAETGRRRIDRVLHTRPGTGGGVLVTEAETEATTHQAPEPSKIEASPPLLLEEIEAYDIPDSFAVAGADLSPSGRIVAWGLNQRFLLLQEADGWSHVSVAGLQQPLSVAWRADSALEVIDAQTSAIITILAQPSARLHIQPSGAAPGSIVAAAPTDDGWALMTSAQGHPARIGLSRNHEFTSQRTVSSLLSYDPSWITVGHDGLVLTELEFPFRVASVSPSDPKPGPLHFANPELPVPADSASPQDHSSWVSLRTLPLDRGYIRTLADTRSDTRLLVLHDSDGRITRATVLDAPLGVIATAPSRRELLMARNINRMELVRYRWRWGRPMEEPPNTTCYRRCRSIDSRHSAPSRTLKNTKWSGS